MSLLKIRTKHRQKDTKLISEVDLSQEQPPDMEDEAGGLFSRI